MILLITTLLQTMKFIITAAMATWLILASYKGWPISTTHSVVGAEIGLALYKAGIEGVKWSSLASVAMVWAMSPLLGMTGSYVACKLLDMVARAKLKNLGAVLGAAKASSLFVLACAAITSFSRGGNDVANTTAFLVLVYPNPFTVRLIGGIGMALGLLTLGRRVVKNVGDGLVEITPLTGLAIQISVAVILFTGTLMGLPLSGTHILVGAVAGIGLARRAWMNRQGLGEIAVTWIITFPGAAVMAAALALLMSSLGLL